MTLNPDLISLLRKLWFCLGRGKQKQFIRLILLMLAASIAEVFSIGMLFPFLALLIDPSRVLEFSGFSYFQDILGTLRPEALLFFVAIVLSAAMILATAIKLTLLYFSTRYSYDIGADLSVDMYRRSLYQPYLIHVGRNSSEIISGINGKVSMVVGSIVIPCMTLISSAILFLSFMTIFIVINPYVVIISSVVLGVTYYTIMQLTKNALKRNSNCIAYESSRVLQVLQEGLGGIRDVLLVGSQEFYCKIYRAADLPMRKAQCSNMFISASPRYLVETVGVLSIIVIALVFRESDPASLAVVPILGVLVLAAQRLLPIVQQAYAALAIMRGAKKTLQDVIELLNQPLPKILSIEKGEPIEFTSSIKFDNVSFRYREDSPWVLENITFEIPKGAKIGIIGQTGSGKSTLINILMGLLSPNQGALQVDKKILNEETLRSWYQLIAHVPQNIYLADTTIAENIAFGVEKDSIDMGLVVLAAKKAQVSSFIETLPDGYSSKIGELGGNLSGGQRQRLGIARAFYRNAQIFVFDEATSALDSATENEVMSSLNSMSKEITVILIAHRFNTLSACDCIIELQNGLIKRIGSYEEFFKST